MNTAITRTNTRSTAKTAVVDGSRSKSPYSSDMPSCRPLQLLLGARQEGLRHLNFNVHQLTADPSISAEDCSCTKSKGVLVDVHECAEALKHSKPSPFSKVLRLESVSLVDSCVCV